MLIDVAGLRPLWSASLSGQVVLGCIRKLAKHEQAREVFCLL